MVAGPRCCRFADVCAACALSALAIRVAPANILIAMALQLKINLPYAVIWNAADTVIKGSHPAALFVGRGRQGNVYLSCALLPRTWNNLGPRHGRALLTAIRCMYLYLFTAAGQLLQLLLEKQSVLDQSLRGKSAVVAKGQPTLLRKLHAQYGQTSNDRTPENNNNRMLPCFRYQYVIGSHFS